MKIFNIETKNTGENKNSNTNYLNLEKIENHEIYSQ